MSEEQKDIVGILYHDKNIYCLLCFQKKFSAITLQHILKRYSPMLIDKKTASERLSPEQYHCSCCEKTLPGLPEIVVRCASCSHIADPFFSTEGWNEELGSLSYITLCKNCEQIRRFCAMQREWGLRRVYGEQIKQIEGRKS